MNIIMIIIRFNMDQCIADIGDVLFYGDHHYLGFFRIFQRMNVCSVSSRFSRVLSVYLIFLKAIFQITLFKFFPQNWMIQIIKLFSLNFTLHFI